MRLIISIFILIITNLNAMANDLAAPNSYCAAIRGNGELMPAHWGAMSRVVENYGMPSVMAGGSSASITMFLIESIHMNRLVKTKTEKALLIKSIEGYVETLSQTDEGRAIYKILTDAEGIKELRDKLMTAAQSMSPDSAMSVSAPFYVKHLQSIQTLLHSSDFKEILNPEFMKYIVQTIAMANKAQETSDQALMPVVQYRHNQITEAIKNFGKFSAKEDPTLFFRPGIISFEKVAQLFGRMGDFYALTELKDPSTYSYVKGLMLQFIDLCSKDSKGKSWQEIVANQPLCRQLLGGSVLKYRQQEKKNEKQKRIHNFIGSKIPSIPTTSVIIGGGKKKFEEFYQRYQMNSQSNFGNDFKIHHTQLRFGYWGQEELLQKIESNLKSKTGYQDAQGRIQNFSKDSKSSKFMSLGQSTWFSALSTSPAEPGLSRIKSMQQWTSKGYVARADLVSAGGWDDLHPSIVLNAAGCHNIIYVTRRGGDSMFGQGVIYKLTNISGFNWEEWEGLSKEEQWEQNARGDISDVGENASSWGKFYNLANPESSYSRSLKLSDAVLCSNWDKQNIRNGLFSVVRDGHEAPLFIHNNKSQSLFSDTNIKQRFASEVDNQVEFAGCVPR